MAQVEKLGPFFLFYFKSFCNSSSGLQTWTHKYAVFRLLILNKGKHVIRDSIVKDGLIIELLYLSIKRSLKTAMFWIQACLAADRSEDLNQFHSLFKSEELSKIPLRNPNANRKVSLKSLDVS